MIGATATIDAADNLAANSSRFWIVELTNVARPDDLEVANLIVQ